MNSMRLGRNNNLFKLPAIQLNASRLGLLLHIIKSITVEAFFMKILPFLHYQELMLSDHGQARQSLSI